MKTRLKVLAGIGALSVVLAGCGSGGDAEPAQNAAPSSDLSQVDYSGDVSVITKYAGENSAFFEKMATEYEAAHPGVHVKLQQESDQGYKDKIKTLVASQSLPDVYFSWAGNYAEQFYDNGVALDLSSQIGTGTPWASTMAPSAVQAFTKDGKTYGVPISLDAKYMVYNKKLFSEAGVQVPTDLAGLLSDCDTLRSKGTTPMAFGNKDGWPAIHYITQLNSYEVPAATLDADYDPATATFADAGYEKALTDFKQILDRCTKTGSGANGVDYYSERDSFGQSKAAMFYVENLEFATMIPKGSKAESDGWGLFRLPAPAGAAGDTGSLTGAPDGFLVNPEAKNPALAVDFLKFVTNADNAKVITETIGYPSPVKGGLTEQNSSPQLRESIDDLGRASRLAIWLDTVTAPEVAQAYLSGVEGLVSGDTSPTDVISSVRTASKQAQ